MPDIHKRITIGVTEKHYEKMEQREQETGMDKANQVRQALSEYL